MTILEEKFEALKHRSTKMGQGEIGEEMSGDASLRPTILDPRSDVFSSGGRFVTHVTFTCLAGTVWWFSTSEHPSLHWKLVFAIFFPVRDWCCYCLRTHGISGAVGG